MSEQSAATPTSTEITIKLDASPDSITPNFRHQIETAARAIAVSLGVCGLTPDFEARRSELIAAAAVFTSPPKDDAEQELMLSKQRDLAAFRISLGKDEDAMKGPLNTARTKIIELVKSGLAGVSAAEARLQGFIQNRQQKLIEERRKVEAAAAAEQKRLADEQAAALRAQQEAERQRQAALIAAQQAELLKGRERIRAQEEAAKLAQQAATAAEDAFLAGLAAEAPKPVAVVPVSDLPMSREVADFEIRGSDVERKGSLINCCAHTLNCFQ
jgi:hypothetical protein